MPGRISRDEMLMEIAHVVSHRGTCPRAQVGAVIAVDARIISSGYVGSPTGQDHCSVVGCEVGTHGGCVRTIHAESNAIGFAAASRGGTRGATLYSTLAPCRECAKLLINSGIARVVYHHTYRDSSGIDLLAEAGVEVERFPTNATKVDR